MTLYELTGTFGMLSAALEEAETDEERDELIAQLEIAGISLAEKCDGYAKAMLNLNAEADALTAESKRLADLAARKSKAVERLKRGVLDAMKASEAEKIETSVGTWKTRLNPPKCVVTDVAKVPPEYLIPQPPTVDKKAILAAYKGTGEIIDGTDVIRAESVSFR